MEDQRMTDLLRALPAERASDDFTRRLLARLDRTDEASPRWAVSGLPVRWAFVAVAAALLLVPFTVQRLTPERRIEKAQARQLLEQIQSEHQQLEQELQMLRQQRSEPVLYLGGDDEVDYVVDLGRVRNVKSDPYNL